MAKGAVRQALGMAGGAAGGLLGSTFGGPGGAAMGASAGRALAARFSKLMGSGDYATNIDDVTNNSLVRYSGASEYASFADSKTSVRLRHREYLQDVFAGGSSTFSNTSFSINPGLSNTFPFLAQLAGNFEEYHMHGLVFEFVSTTSPYNSSAAMGAVIMAMEYNASSPAFTSKPQMENSDFAVSARPDKSMIYGVECANNASNNYYVRQGSTSLPLTTTDLGLFNIATLTPIPAGTTLGELWVSYDVELFRPKISASRYGYAHFSRVVPITVAPASTLTTANLGASTVAALPNGVRYGSASTFSLGTVANGPSVFMTDADVGDTYLLVVDIAASSSPSIASYNITYSGCDAANVWSGYSATSASTGATGGITVAVLITVTSNAVTPTITITTVNAPTVAGFIDIMLSNVGNGLSGYGLGTPTL